VDGAPSSVLIPSLLHLDSPYLHLEPLAIVVSAHVFTEQHKPKNATLSRLNQKLGSLQVCNNTTTEDYMITPKSKQLSRIIIKSGIVNDVTK